MAAKPKKLIGGLPAEWMHETRAFTPQVIQLARVLDWRVAHFRPAMTNKGWRTAVAGDGAGFPDLVMAHVKQERTIFAELKSERGKASPEQITWEMVLRGAGAEFYLWRPSDYDDIERILRGKTI